MKLLDPPLELSPIAHIIPVLFSAFLYLVYDKKLFYHSKAYDNDDDLHEITKMYRQQHKYKI